MSETKRQSCFGSRIHHLDLSSATACADGGACAPPLRHQRTSQRCPHCYYGNCAGEVHHCSHYETRMSCRARRCFVHRVFLSVHSMDGGFCCSRDGRAKPKMVDDVGVAEVRRRNQRIFCWRSDNHPVDVLAHCIHHIIHGLWFRFTCGDGMQAFLSIMDVISSTRFDVHGERVVSSWMLAAFEKVLEEPTGWR